MTTKKFLSSIVAFSCMYSNVFSAEATQEPAICENAPNPIRASIRHIEPNGIGYNQGYTSFDAFLAALQNLIKLDHT